MARLTCEKVRSDRISASKRDRKIRNNLSLSRIGKIREHGCGKSDTVRISVLSFSNECGNDFKGYDMNNIENNYNDDNDMDNYNNTSCHIINQ